MTGALSLVELCNSNREHRPKLIARAVADFELAGIVERVGGGFRLTSTAAAEYGPAFGFIKETNVPLVPGDDDGLTHFPQGPQKARVAA